MAMIRRYLRKNGQERGFALLISVIFMSVMLTFGLALAALAFKQEVLASSAVESQVAFYAADAALECALYADQRAGVFAYDPDVNHPIPTFKCNGQDPYVAPDRQFEGSGAGQREVLTYRFSLDSGKHCADVKVYKPAPTADQTFYTFSQGYDTGCDVVANPLTARFASRGLEVHIIDTTPAPFAAACTLTASPESIKSGDTVQLIWTTTNATSFSIDHGIGSVTPVASGATPVTPASDITYTGTASGPGGTATCSDTVTVTP